MSIRSPVMLAALSLAHALGMAPAPDPAASWPAAAGHPPRSTPVVFKDPEPRYFDPPAGRYRLADGTSRDADPPKGFYDPPPGYYPVDVAQASAYGASLGPLPTAEGSLAAWQVKRRRLRIGLGISGGVLGLSALAPVFSLAAAAARPDSVEFPCLDCWSFGELFAVVVGPPALIVTIVYAVRLGVHAKRRPKTNLALAPGGLLWRF